MAERSTSIGRRLLSACAAALSLACAFHEPEFSPGNFTPDPSMFVDVTSAGANELLAEKEAQAAMYRSDLKMVLWGAAKLGVTTDGQLTVNLPKEGDSFTSACNFWFRAPIHTAEWQTASDKAFVLRLDVGQYEVEENCGSPYDDTIPLIVSFGTLAEGEQFMNLMAALERSQASAGDATP